MTYGELKKRVLQLIFSYTIAGDDIELSYNNQEDYVKLIPGLLSTAQSLVYNVVHMDDAILLKDLHKEDIGESYLYSLPDDCQKMKPGLVLPKSKNGPFYGPDPFERFNGYKIIGGKKMMVPKGIDENLIMEYRKRGHPIPDNVQDNYVLKNIDEINEIIPFYIAAFVVLYDDAFRYAALYNEFESRLQRLQYSMSQAYTETNTVFDVYGNFGM